MHFTIINTNSVAVVTFAKGKVNAINKEVIEELFDIIGDLEKDKGIKSMVLTGQGKFVSFGFDVPEVYGYSPQKMTAFVRRFAKLLSKLFLYPKPIVAAINGHATAGGCLLALTADYRILVDTNAKMSLHEVSFGASLFPSAVEILRYVVGNTNAETILLSGKMLAPSDALKLKMVNQLCDDATLSELSKQKAVELSQNYGAAYGSLKRNLRREAVEDGLKGDVRGIREWIKIWYSDETRKKTSQIKIY